jgi:hypothetical protein
MNKQGMLIKRLLLFRLLLVALFLSVALGSVAFLVEVQQLGGRIREQAQMGVEVLRIEMPHLLITTKNSDARELPLQRIADDFTRQPPRSNLGRFILLIYYDASMREKARANDPAYPDVQRLADAVARIEAGSQKSAVVFGDMLNGSYGHSVPFIFTISGDRGEALGYLKGAFALSPVVEAELLRSALQASALAIAFVLITAIVIYPTIRNLIARQERQARQLFLANIDIIKVIGSIIAKRDSETDAHNYRVTIYSLRLAEAVGLNPKDIYSLLKGAFLHDVGKIGIPDAILHKPGSLSEEEMAEMQNHVRYGLEIVGNAAWLADAASIIGCHHEKFDGSGYPNRLAGDAIPLTARIFAIADVFDALTSARPYKKAFGVEESLEILRQGTGHHFDPMLIALFEPMAARLLATVTGHAEELPHLLENLAMSYFDLDQESTLPVTATESLQICQPAL